MSLLPCSDNSSSHYAINYHRIITLFTLHNIHTISTHRICTISAQYLHNIFTISAHYLRRICTISAQYLLSIYTLSTHRICTISTPYLHTIYMISIHSPPCRRHCRDWSALRAPPRGRPGDEKRTPRARAEATPHASTSFATLCFAKKSDHNYGMYW